MDCHEKPVDAGKIKRSANPRGTVKKHRNDAAGKNPVSSGSNPQAGLHDQNRESACCHGSDLPIPVKSLSLHN